MNLRRQLLQIWYQARSLVLLPFFSPSPPSNVPNVAPTPSAAPTAPSPAPSPVQIQALHTDPVSPKVPAKVPSPPSPDQDSYPVPDKLPSPAPSDEPTNTDSNTNAASTFELSCETKKLSSYLKSGSSELNPLPAKQT